MHSLQNHKPLLCLFCLYFYLGDFNKPERENLAAMAPPIISKNCAFCSSLQFSSGFCFPQTHLWHVTTFKNQQHCIWDLKSQSFPGFLHQQQGLRVTMYANSTCTRVPRMESLINNKEIRYIHWNEAHSGAALRNSLLSSNLWRDPAPQPYSKSQAVFSPISLFLRIYLLDFSPVSLLPLFLW